VVSHHHRRWRYINHFTYLLAYLLIVHTYLHRFHLIEQSTQQAEEFGGAWNSADKMVEDMPTFLASAAQNMTHATRSQQIRHHTTKKQMNPDRILNVWLKVIAALRFPDHLRITRVIQVSRFSRKSSSPDYKH